MRVAILEDDPGVLRSTVHTLAASARYTLAWQAESLTQARAQLHLPFDLLLLDLGLPDGRGVELIPAARAVAPQAAIVAFTVFDDASNVIEAVEAGVDGYLLKSADAETLLETLASAAAGESPISPAVAGILLRRLRRQESSEPRALPPKQDRLMALTARIRPHFLFNSLNAVLGVIRSDPRRAESALEELSDLFRALMRDNRELVPLSEEIGLARQYIDLERLRLGNRLKVRWEVETCPPDALVPPLMLQPLLENAVYHGIEPLGETGEIRIALARIGDRIRFELSNPFSEAHAGHHGNRMALANIRERLLLFFDLEATMSTGAEGGDYVVRIELPYRKEKAP